jgi:hypothetical protein
MPPPRRGSIRPLRTMIRECPAGATVYSSAGDVSRTFPAFRKTRNRPKKISSRMLSQREYSTDLENIGERSSQMPRGYSLEIEISRGANIAFRSHSFTLRQRCTHVYSRRDVARAIDPRIDLVERERGRSRPSRTIKKRVAGGVALAFGKFLIKWKTDGTAR